MGKLDYSSVQLVTSAPGTLPVVLTCPHGGEKAPPDVDLRQGTDPDCEHFSTVLDAHTRDVTESVAQGLVELSGEGPFVVMADFSRKYVDANREAPCAYEQATAAAYYDRYHSTIRGFIDEVRAANPGLTFLFDIHGTDNPGADVYLGTQNGTTIQRLLALDPEAMWRSNSVAGRLRAAGYAVLPPIYSHATGLSGGYTVQTYGSHLPDGLDAIQVELLARLRRNPTTRNEFTASLAATIHAFVLQYSRLPTATGDSCGA